MKYKTPGFEAERRNSLCINTVQLSISSFSLCRASYFKSGNPPNALASLCLCGSLRQAAPRLR
ncbi:MAG: hypothetical protein ICV54_18020 [Nostoc sp. C3-bin3]|nr:hypothetical protein [Nostoc sp. C3-bin3]